MRLQSSCSAGKNPQVPAGLVLTLLKAPLTRLPAGVREGGGRPGGAGFAPGAGRESGRGGAAAGRVWGSAATCFPALRGGALPPLASAAAPRYPPPQRPLAASRGPRWAARVEAQSRSPRSLPVVPVWRLLSEQSRSPRELGRWVGGAGAGNPSRDRRVPGQVPARGAARPSPLLARPSTLTTPGALPAPCRSALPGALFAEVTRDVFTGGGSGSARAPVFARALGRGGARRGQSSGKKEIPLFVGVGRAR